MKPNVTKVFFFGDSICFGQGISLHKGWIPSLSLSLENFCKENDYQVLVINSAVNGRTSRMALENMPFEIQSHEPDILVVQFGMNDCNYWQSDRGLPRVSPESFAANLKEIIDRALHFGTKKIILNTNHPTCLTEEKLTNSDISYQQSNMNYNAIIRDVAVFYPQFVLLNDMEKHFINHSKGDLQRYLLPDKLHLSEQGHLFYFNVIDPIVKNILKEIECSK